MNSRGEEIFKNSQLRIFQNQIPSQFEEVKLISNYDLKKKNLIVIS